MSMNKNDLLLEFNENIKFDYNFPSVTKEKKSLLPVIGLCTFLFSLVIYSSWYYLNINNSAHYEANLLKLSIDKAQSKLKWHPKWNFDLAIEKTMEWYKSVHGGVSPTSITKSQIELYEKSWT